VVWRFNFVPIYDTLLAYDTICIISFNPFTMRALHSRILWASNCYSHLSTNIINSNMTSFFRFVTKQPIYRLGIISLAHAPVHVTNFPVVNAHVDELSSARIWQHTLCATLSASVNINYCLPIIVYYRICTLRHIRIEIIHGSQNGLWLGIKY
jgi:hypothetical protein